MTIGRDAELLSGEVIDSIGALRLAAFVEEEFQIDIQPSDFVIENFRSVAVIAGYVGRAAAARGPEGEQAMSDPGSSGRSRDAAAAPQELTHSQKQIWVGQRLNPASPLYNMAFAFVFPAELRADLFCEAWQRVVDASDALRTRVVDDESGSARWTLAARGRSTEVIEFDPRPDPDGAFRQWCRERCARPLPLGGDLVDSVLVRLGDGRTGWYLNQHHLVADAWSTHLLYGQVGAEYEGLLRGDGTGPPALPAYYPTMAALPAGTATRASALEHWRARRQRPGRSVPLYGRRADPVGTASTRLTLELDEGRSRAIDRLCRQAGLASLSDGVSRFALFATLLVSWLHRISGNLELGFDTPVNGRPTPQARRALGVFIEMFPFSVAVEHRRHLQDAGGQVPAGIHAPAAPCAAGRQRSLGRHGRQRRPQLRARRVRDLRGAPGRGGLGAPGTRRQRACPSAPGPRLLGGGALRAALRLQRRGARAATAAPQSPSLRDAARRRARGSRPPDRRDRRPRGGRTPGARRAQRHRRGPAAAAVGDRDVRGSRGPRSGPGRRAPGEDVADVRGAPGAVRRAGGHAAGAGARAGRPRRDRRPPVHALRPCHSRHAQGARGVRPDRSLDATGAPRLRAAGLRRPHAPRRGGRVSCACAAGAHGALRRRGDSRRRRGEAGPARTEPGRPRVPDVHVRVDGPAQGRADRPRRPGGLPVLGGAPLRPRRPSHLSAVHLPRLRPHGHQPVPAADHRGDDGGLP